MINRHIWTFHVAGWSDGGGLWLTKNGRVVGFRIGHCGVIVRRLYDRANAS